MSGVIICYSEQDYTVSDCVTGVIMENGGPFSEENESNLPESKKKGFTEL